VSGAATATARRPTLAASSFVLLVGKSAQMAAGLVFWLVAARTATVEQVGLATATVSAVMLCTQLALLGAGSAVITELHRERRADRLLDTTFSVVIAFSTLLGLGYLLVAGQFSRQLGTVFSHPGFAALFIVAAIFGTLIICFDQVSVAVGRSGETAVRYAVGGVLTVGLVAGVAFAGDTVAAPALFACWAVGGVAACVIGGLQLRRATGYRYHPTLARERVWRLLRIGVPNQLLTLTERLPALVIPVLVADLASPTMAAYWYPAWMMAWGVYTAPIMVGLVQFADTVRRPGEVRAMAVKAARWSLLFGGPVAIGVAVLAGPLLGLLGGAYADASVTGLRVLVIGLLPYTLLQAYNAACRATGRLAEAVAAGLVTAVLAVGGTVMAALAGSVTLMAVAWVAALTLAGGWSVMRLRRIAAAPAESPAARTAGERLTAAEPAALAPATEGVAP
jgi:O-antigen/teichoic acid export membrane protein